MNKNRMNLRMFQDDVNIIDRTGAESLIPTQEAKEIIQGTIAQSAVLSRGRKLANMTSKQYGKGGKERTVYLNERTNMYLQEYLQSRTDNNPALFVGLKSPHKRLSKAGIEDMIRRTGERAGVEKAHPHRFRGTSITNAINRGMPLQEASIMAGHAKTETTMLYCSVDQESVKYHHKKYLSA